MLGKFQDMQCYFRVDIISQKYHKKHYLFQHRNLLFLFIFLCFLIIKLKYNITNLLISFKTRNNLRAQRLMSPLQFI